MASSATTKHRNASRIKSSICIRRRFFSRLASDKPHRRPHHAIKLAPVEQMNDDRHARWPRKAQKQQRIEKHQIPRFIIATWL